MDYSKTGCENLIKRAKNLKLKIEVINQDLFIPNSKYFNGFSLVYSIGLVEHFDDLKYILSFTKKYINTGGYHIALIPNLSGIYGWMAKYIDNEVYKIHNPHNLKSFIEGHEEANLEVIYASYQGYFNVGVLSSLKPFKENWFFHKKYSINV